MWYASVGWNKLTSTSGNGDTYEASLIDHAQIVSGDYAPESFGFSLDDRDATALDELLIDMLTPAVTDKADPAVSKIRKNVWMRNCFGA